MEPLVLFGMVVGMGQGGGGGSQCSHRGRMIS